MAKKKNKNKGGGAPKPLSDKEFIKQKIRSLPIGRCFCSCDFESRGIGFVIVSRKHQNGKTSLAVFLLDTFCLGVKDTYYKLRLDDYEFDDFIADLPSSVEPCSYELAHNWVYEAEQFASEVGLDPHKDFAITKYFLEEDTDDIPIIDLPLGKDGEYFLVAKDRLEASKYLPTLREYLEDDLKYIIIDEDDDDDGFYDDDFYDDDESLDGAEGILRDMIKDIHTSKMFRYYGPDTEYTYKHPEYPGSYELHSTDDLFGLLRFDPDNSRDVRKWIDKMLSLPHDLLRHDLESILWFVMGRDCDKSLDDFDVYPDDEGYILINCVTLLAEVGSGDSSLDVILEIMRQNDSFTEFYFADISAEIIGYAILKLGKNHLDKLMSFAKEEGLLHYNKIDVISAVKYFAIYDMLPRENVIEWYRELLKFATSTLPKTQFIDSCTAGFIASSVLDLQAHELINEVSDMFETGLVDEGVCGDFNDFMSELTMPEFPGVSEKIKTNIYDIYDFLSK